MTEENITFFSTPNSDKKSVMRSECQKLCVVCDHHNQCSNSERCGEKGRVRQKETEKRHLMQIAILAIISECQPTIKRSFLFFFFFKQKKTTTIATFNLFINFGVVYTCFKIFKACLQFYSLNRSEKNWPKLQLSISNKTKIRT